MSTSEHFPPYLYKYRSLRNRPEDLALDIARLRSIFKGYLYAASPTEFNDPLDCAPVVRVNPDNEYVRKYVQEGILRHLKRTGHQQPYDQVAAIAAENLRERGVLAIAKSTVEKTLSEATVISLSELNDNTLMWGHYASSHTGICLRFSMRPGSWFRQALPVTYRDERPSYEWPDDGEPGLTERLMLSKATCWRYEGEWRIVKPGVSRTIGYPSSLLDGVIFGARTAEASREAVVAEIRAMKTAPVELFEATLAMDAYRLDIVNLGVLTR